MNIPAGFFEGSAALFLAVGALIGWFSRMHLLFGASLVTFAVFGGLLVLAFATEPVSSLDGILVALLGLYALFCGVTSLTGSGAARFLKKRRET
ncbi:MAG: hypothetical protein KAF27_10780 [Porphyrobacter sp.]|nr:hypothetical protein [Porphyrobacter sp.]